MLQYLVDFIYDFPVFFMGSFKKDKDIDLKCLKCTMFQAAYESQCSEPRQNHHKKRVVAKVWHTANQLSSAGDVATGANAATQGPRKTALTLTEVVFLKGEGRFFISKKTKT